MKQEYELCRDEARAFLYVANKIEEDIDFFMNDGMYPFCVNIAFACELYLKAIYLYYSNKGIHGHEIDDLYDALSENVKIQIEMLFKQEYQYDLDEILRNIRNTFVEWRYAFEKDKVEINVTGISTLARVLQKYVDDNIK